MSTAVAIQPALFADLDDAFEAFHHANPDVLDRLVTVVATVAAAADPDGPAPRVSLRDAFGKLRLEAAMAGRTDANGYALNNNLTSRYALLLKELHPEFRPLLATRGVQSAAVPRIAAEIRARRATADCPNRCDGGNVACWAPGGPCDPRATDGCDLCGPCNACGGAR